MGQVLMKQWYNDGSSLNNYVSTDIAGAKIIAPLLNSEIELYEKISSKDNSDSVGDTRIAKIQLYSESGDKRYFEGRVLKSKTRESIEDDLLPFTKADIDLVSLK